MLMVAHEALEEEEEERPPNAEEWTVLTVVLPISRNHLCCGSFVMN